MLMLMLTQLGAQLFQLKILFNSTHFRAKMHISAFLLCLVAGFVTAPFPETHPYSFLNPVIDPWWAKLDKETQMSIYELWEKHEPSLFALGQLKHCLLISNSFLLQLKL